MGKYKAITKNVDKGVTSAMAGCVMESLYGSDEYSAKKATVKKPADVSGFVSVLFGAGLMSAAVLDKRDAGVKT